MKLHWCSPLQRKFKRGQLHLVTSVVCNLNLAVYFRRYLSAKTLKPSEFKLKTLKWVLHFRGQFSLLNSACHPELVEYILVPPGQEGKRQIERCVVLVLFRFKQSAWDPGPTSGDNPRSCEWSCRNHYWRIFHGIKDFREGWAELLRKISGNTLKEQHMHSGRHLKGAPSKRDEAKKRIY